MVKNYHEGRSNPLVEANVQEISINDLVKMTAAGEM